MKKTYSLMLVEGPSNSPDNVYIRLYDEDDAGQIPYINAAYLKLEQYKHKSKFDYKRLLESDSVILPFNKLVRNFKFSKKEFRIIYKIIKAWKDNSYYTFKNGKGCSSIQYTIVGNDVNIEIIANSSIIFHHTKIYQIKSLLEFFSLEFKRNIML